MLASERLIEIECAFAHQVQAIIPLELDGETLRLTIYLKDGTNLRLAEQWSDSDLERYSYYWLSAENELKIGWDNAPHHTRLENYPHHKHVGKQNRLEPSFFTIPVPFLIFCKIKAARCGTAKLPKEYGMS